MWQIIINGPGYFDTPYDLPEGTTSLGRADENDIVLSGDLVSRRHGRIHVRAEEIGFEDLGSRNGTRINGDVRRGTTPLQAGDSVSVGENTLSIRRPAAAEAAATEMVSAERLGLASVPGATGSDLPPAVLVSRDIKDSAVLRALDNVLPFEAGDGLSALVPGHTSEKPQVSYASLLLLYKIAELLGRAPALDLFLDETVDRIMQWATATTVVVLQRANDGTLRATAMRHRGPLTPGQVPVSASVVNTALTQGAALAVADVREDARFAHRDSVLLFGVGRVLCVPLGDKPPFRGVLYLNTPAGPETELNGLLDLVTALAHLVNTGIEKFGLRTGGPDEGTLRKLLQQHLPPDVAERRIDQLRRLEVAKPSLEHRAFSVLVVSLSGFDAYLAHAEPGLVSELVSSFHQRATSVVFSFEGMVAHRTADSLVVLFGTPEAHPDHPLRAVRAALALRGDWARHLGRHPELEPLHPRSAVASGEGLVGTTSSEPWLGYSAFGEPMTQAMLMASGAESAQVLITGKTLASIGARFDVLPLGPRALRPGAEKVPVFDVLEEDATHNTEPGV